MNRCMSGQASSDLHRAAAAAQIGAVPIAIVPGVLLGALVGFILSSLLDDRQLADFGWRIALLLGVSIVPFALMLRRSLLASTTGSRRPRARRTCSTP